MTLISMINLSDRLKQRHYKSLALFLNVYFEHEDVNKVSKMFPQAVIVLSSRREMKKKLLL